MATHEIDEDWEGIWGEIKEEVEEQYHVPPGFKSIRQLEKEWGRGYEAVTRVLKQGNYEVIERLVNGHNTKLYRPISP